MEGCPPHAPPRPAPSNRGQECSLPSNVGLHHGLTLAAGMWTGMQGASEWVCQCLPAPRSYTQHRPEMRAAGTPSLQASHPSHTGVLHVLGVRGYPTFLKNASTCRQPFSIPVGLEEGLQRRPSSVSTPQLSRVLYVVAFAHILVGRFIVHRFVASRAY